MKNNSFETVAMIVRGYIALPTATVIAGRGSARHRHRLRADVGDTINGGRIHTFEPGLEAAYCKMSQAHNFYGNGRAAQRIAETVSHLR